MRKILSRSLFTIALLSLVLAVDGLAQTTAFTYQGRLSDGASAANGPYDMKFTLMDANGTPQGAPSTVIFDAQPVTVADGIFTVELNFGPTAFPGADRFLEIAVRPHTTDPNATYTVLAPRQKVTATPYAIHALTAETATNTQQLGGVAASAYVQTSDARLSDARTPTSGSGNYIQNSTAQQASSNFNIAGNGTLGGTLSAGTVNTASAYNISGNRVLSIAGTNNVFAGVLTGGSATTSSANSFLGFGAGGSTTTGSRNSFVGYIAGFLNTEGNNNTFVGLQAGASNTTGSNNTIIGSLANVSSNLILNYATAIGANAIVSTDDTIVLGKAAGTYNSTARPADTVLVPGNLNVAGTITGAFSVTNLTGAGAAGTYLRSNGTNFMSSPIQSSDVPNIDASKITSGVLGVPRIPDLGPTYIRNQTSQQSAANFNIAGNGTVGGAFTANSVNILSGGDGLFLNDNFLRLRGPNDSSNALFYSSDVGGVEFRAQSGFRWTNGTSGATQRMVLDGTGQLIVGSKLWTMGGILARGGAPGANNLSNNGFAFQGNSGDNDSGLFSNSDHQVSLYADNIERLRVTNNETQIFGRGGVNQTFDTVTYTVRGLASDGTIFRAENSNGTATADFRSNGTSNLYGDLFVSGSKNFEIDHPLDPANKNLRHNAVEGPGYYTFYHGTVTLDADGSAWVELPAYYDALNGETHYQLTCVGGYAPVYVATEVKDNRFQIAGGRAGLKISWQITGDRQDPYARDNPYQAEVEKRSTEKGSYLYPKGYGQPATRRGGAAQKQAGEAGRQP